MLTAEQVSGTDDFVAGLADGLEDITESDCNENGENCLSFCTRNVVLGTKGLVRLLP